MQLEKVITYPLLWKGRGNLGNQLFEIASCAGIAKKAGASCIMPTWNYQKYFQGSFVEFSNSIPKLPVKREASYAYDPSLNVDISMGVDGWLQSPLYWGNDQEFILNEVFKFKPEFLASLPHVPSGTVAVSVRRGDYIGNPNYYLLGIDYYLKAMKSFPEGTKFLVFSDDFDYCKHHFGDSVSYAQGFDAISQLALMSKCSAHIISNSTFAWWGAYLSNSYIVRRPSVHIHDILAKDHDWSMHYPEDWKEVEQLDSFPEVAFTIPVSYDHPDRIENLRLAIAYILRFFPGSRIYVSEQGMNKHFDWVKEYGCKYRHYAFMGEFHRTKMLNDMAKRSIEDGCDVIVNYDADVIVPPVQMHKAIESAEQYGMVFPYDGRFARVPRSRYGVLLDTLDTGVLAGVEFPGMRKGDMLSVGGCVVWDADALKEVGYENENFVNYGPEDVERAVRFKTLMGREPHRIQGALYHVDHFVGKNSSGNHDYFRSNNMELERVKSMGVLELKEYVSLWGWK